MDNLPHPSVDMTVVGPCISSTVSHPSHTPPSQQDSTLTSSSLSSPHSCAESNVPNKSQRNVEEHYNNLESDEEKKSFEKAWNERKHVLEQAAEARALVVFNNFQKDNKSLQQVIDSSLTDYVEMYEKAHTVRLQFEAEKADWTRQVRGQSMSDEMDAAAAASSSSRGHRKAMRCEEQDDAISAYRNQMARVGGNDSQEFQYCSQPNQVEEEWRNHSSETAASGTTMDVDVDAEKPTAMPSRTVKKFLVPVKSVAIVASTD